MALNLQTFRTRALTAILFAMVMIGGLLIDKWTTFVLFTIIHLGCWWEYFKLQEKIYQTTIHFYTRYGFMLLGFGLQLLLCGNDYVIAGYGLRDNAALPVSAAGFIFLVLGIFQRGAINMKQFVASAIGWLYLSVPIGLLLIFRASTSAWPAESIYWRDMGILLPAIIIASIWINDTMAYIMGSLIGRTPLSSISPKKTVEGTLSGIILAVLVAALIGSTIGLLLWPVIIISAVTAVAGTIGDLLESKLKRMAAVKDSGSFMPGHGGFLDRFDSLLIAVPAVAVYLLVLRLL